MLHFILNIVDKRLAACWTVMFTEYYIHEHLVVAFCKKFGNSHVSSNPEYAK